MLSRRVVSINVLMRLYTTKVWYMYGMGELSVAGAFVLRGEVAVAVLPRA